MSGDASPPYHLRPNKAVDRELFLALLSRIGTELEIEKYRYIGLGGPFLEDFRLVHSRLGISDMVCVEARPDIHARQVFNRPIPLISCVHGNLEDFIEATKFSNPVIIWFDYTDPSGLYSQIRSFLDAIPRVPIYSVLRLTLNANPNSLGQPQPDDKRIVMYNDSRLPGKPTLREWRLDRLRDRMSELFLGGLTPEDITRRKLGHGLLRLIEAVVVEKNLLNSDRRVVWALSTCYSDGQPMATTTVVVCPKEEYRVDAMIHDWEYARPPDNALIIDMPTLSTLERLTMESSEIPEDLMRFTLPRSSMGEDPYESFRKFYRMFPHFSRVEF